MSYLNLGWVNKNFNQENFTFLDIGAADLDVSFRLRQVMPDAKIYAIEAADHWHDANVKRAAENNINYFKYAVCDVDGETSFYPSLTEGENPHLFSSSIFELNPAPDNNPTKKVYGSPYKVDSIRLETFCKKHNIIPDFIHIDVEGAEFKVFQNMGIYKPKCIWAEVVAFSHYNTGVTLENFNDLMSTLGYRAVYSTHGDTLYCQIGANIAPYVP
jgi:FkbM family methyltransferase